MVDPNLQRQALLAALAGGGAGGPGPMVPNGAAMPGAGAAPPLPGPPGMPSMGGPPGLMPPQPSPTPDLMAMMAKKFAPFLPPVLGHHPYPGDAPEPGSGPSPAQPTMASSGRGRRP
jgi:hypothetical protein